jgi:3-oxoacyl-[acyl-carrier-protein] synthase-3
MNHATIAGIEYFLPSHCVTNAQLASEFPTWASSSVPGKLGIDERRIASEQECASDLAVEAVKRLFTSYACRPEQIDYLLLCTQSPDYVLPTTACLLQHRLGIPTTAGALDFNLGCSGFVYGLGLAEGLIVSGQARSVLLITADTYSKYISRSDLISRAIFGDGAAATLLTAIDIPSGKIGPFVYGTDGRGEVDLIVPNSGSRHRTNLLRAHCSCGSVRDTEAASLHMNGNEVFQFAVTHVPLAVRTVLSKADLTLGEIDLFVFHQANAFIIEEIRAVLNLPLEKVQVTLRNCANTVSSTIPIALKHAEMEGRLKSGSLILVAGFGVGYSWAASIVRW